jgi:molecular chaperone DnaJ
LPEKQKEIIGRYAAMVDSHYAKPSASTDDHSSSAKDEESKSSGGKDGFFKNAFGKFKDKLSSDEDQDEKPSKKKD